MPYISKKKLWSLSPQTAPQVDEDNYTSATSALNVMAIVFKVLKMCLYHCFRWPTPDCFLFLTSPVLSPYDACLTADCGWLPLKATYTTGRKPTVRPVLPIHQASANQYSALIRPHMTNPKHTAWKPQEHELHSPGTPGRKGFQVFRLFPFQLPRVPSS